MDKPSPLVVDIDKIKSLGIDVGSPEWFDLLAGLKTFSYNGADTKMNCVKRSNGKWYASKKIHSSIHGRQVAVTLYIGGDQSCTLEKLEYINSKFGMGKDFWKWYHSSERTGQSNRKQGCTSGEIAEECTPLADNSSQTRDETGELRARIAELEQSNFELKAANQALEKQLSECSLQPNSADKEEIRRLNAELGLVKSMREDFRSKWEKAREDNSNLLRELKDASNESLHRPDPGELLNRLRKERKNSKAKLEDIELVLELAQAIAL
jgi:regulator of replication initiation timing